MEVSLKQLHTKLKLRSQLLEGIQRTMVSATCVIKQMPLS